METSFGPRFYFNIFVSWRQLTSDDVRKITDSHTRVELDLVKDIYDFGPDVGGNVSDFHWRLIGILDLVRDARQNGDSRFQAVNADDKEESSER